VEPRWRNPNWTNWLQWLKAVSKFGPDIPIKRTVRRDRNDDPVIMAAVSVRAEYIVTGDNDLLDLEKPHGVACVTPRAFLSLVLRNR
jgi:predicted nucleic acid-binding protein